MALGGLPPSGLVEVNSGVPLQVVAPGGNSLKVTVPVGLKPPVTVAVSLMVVPTGPPAEGVVAMAGVALIVVTGSSSQPGLTMVTMLLLASPL